MTELYDILPLELKASFENGDYDDGDPDGGLQANSIKYLNNEVHFDFSIYLGYNREYEIQNWQLQVLNYQDSKIDIDNLGCYFNFYSDHFLLWEFNESEVGLYFQKSTLTPELLLSEIYTIHNDIFENYIPLEKYINGHNLLTLCKYNSGIFGSGPKQILNYYFDCLEKAGMEPYYFGETNRPKWDGKKHVPADTDFKLATIGGTYFIGQNFKFVRIDSEDPTNKKAIPFLKRIFSHKIYRTFPFLNRFI